MNWEYTQQLEHIHSIEDETIYTPREILTKIHNLIRSQGEFRKIWVEGEIYNFTKNEHSKHIYFSLKDEHSSLDCVYFFYKQDPNLLKNIQLENGKKILAFGDITLYKKNGRCQLNIEKISELKQKGNIYEKIRKIYEKLEKEGLFSPERKKKLPKLPITIGIATSENGAALRDIIKIARSRFPDINIIISPCLVQGDNAAESIANAIRALNDPRLQVDVIIAGRGGGSFEDLLIFNDEVVVRAFAESKVPIVSAVGHQIDHPICEYAADQIAATPSNAAEMVVPEIQSIQNQIENLTLKIQYLLNHQLTTKKERLQLITNRKVFLDPYYLFESYYQSLDDYGYRIENQFKHYINQKRSELKLLEEKLNQLNPNAPLKRGYVFITKNNQVVKSAKQLKEKETFSIHFYQEIVNVKISEISVPEQKKL